MAEGGIQKCLRCCTSGLIDPAVCYAGAIGRRSGRRRCQEMGVMPSARSDNAVAERFFETLEREALNRRHLFNPTPRPGW
jgi:hypothetical protein